MAVVATGFFDGVHLGHRKVIDALLSCARERGEQSVIATFWPHPRAVLQNEARDLRLLMSMEEKEAVLRSLGVDRIEVIPFTHYFASLTSREYLEQFVKGRCSGTTVVLGYDNRIGSDLLECEDLSRAAVEVGLEVVRCAPLGDISSTKIRNCLAAGKLEMANEMLGAPYSLRGVVIPGNQLGRTLGYPTANVRSYEPLKILPMTGAYFTKVKVVGREFYGMTNVGAAGKVETHIFGLAEDIYGLDIELIFLKFMRAEQSFQNTEDLKRQLDIDRMSCQNIIFGL